MFLFTDQSEKKNNRANTDWKTEVILMATGI